MTSTARFPYVHQTTHMSTTVEAPARMSKIGTRKEPQMKRFWSTLMLTVLAVCLWAMAGTATNVTAQTSPITVSVATDKETYAPGEEVRFTLQVRNTGAAAVRVTRPTAQAFDFVVPRAGQPPRAAVADQLWAWSDNRQFAAAAEYMDMETGRTLTFSETWDQRDKEGALVGAGTFTVQGIFITDQNIQPAVATFTIGQGGRAPQQVVVPLSGVGGASVRGTAILTAQNDGTQIILDVTGLPAGATAETRLHAGTCAQMSSSAAQLPDLRADASGQARATGQVLFRGTEPVALSTLLDGSRVITVTLSGPATNVLVACGSIQPAGTPVATTVRFDAVGNSGVSGSARLAAQGIGTEISLDVRGLPTGVTAEVRLQAGTCTQPSLSSAQLPDLRAGSSGRAQAAGQVLFRGTEPVLLSTLLDGSHVITVHLPGRVVACGPIQSTTVAPTASTIAAVPTMATQTVPSDSAWFSAPPGSTAARPTCPDPNQWTLLYWGGQNEAGIAAAAQGCPNAGRYWANQGGRWLGYSPANPQASDVWSLQTGVAVFVLGTGN